jgi:hypothetical protein
MITSPPPRFKNKKIELSIDDFGCWLMFLVASGLPGFILQSYGKNKPDKFLYRVCYIRYVKNY